ncbi:MAG: glycosyltransferase family 4 protein [Vulcanimicrobiaceae bacterium]
MQPGDSALNAYSHYLAHALAADGLKVEIVSPIGQGTPARWEDAPNVSVIPSYRRGDIKFATQAARGISNSNSSLLHVQHELFAYGGIMTAMSLPYVLHNARLRGRRVISTIHGVIPLDSIDDKFVGEFMLRAPAPIVRGAWRLLIRAVASGSDAIHVHDKQHKAWLQKQYGVLNRPIYVIPFGPLVHENAFVSLDRLEARRRLNLPIKAHVLLFFGFHSPYKGLDYILQAAPSLLESDPSLYIIIAGKSPERFEVERSCVTANRSRLLFTGFVPDGDIPSYFIGSDALILPYKVNLATSGPLGIAVASGLPVLASSLFLASYPQMPCTFELSVQALRKAVLSYFTDAEIRRRAKEFIVALRSEMSWAAMALSLRGIYSLI